MVRKGVFPKTQSKNPNFQHGHINSRFSVETNKPPRKLLVVGQLLCCFGAHMLMYFVYISLLRSLRLPLTAVRLERGLMIFKSTEDSKKKPIRKGHLSLNSVEHTAVLRPQEE